MASLPSAIQFESVSTKQSDRPDVTEAAIVISGGRAFKTADDYERLIGGLADKVGGGTGSSRAAVDAGIAPNENRLNFHYNPSVYPMPSEYLFLSSDKFTQDHWKIRCALTLNSVT